MHGITSHKEHSRCAANSVHTKSALVPALLCTHSVSVLRSEWNLLQDRRIHVRVAGADGLPCVVLVHGLGVSSRYFVPLMRSLSADFAVIAPDLGGVGRSEAPNAVATIEGLGAELRALLDLRGIERAVFLGNSMGCQVLIELATIAPERIDRMILVGPTVDPRFRTFARQILRWLLEASREPLAIFPTLVLDYFCCGARRFFAMGRHALDDRPEHKLPSIAVPTRVIRGERDAFVSAEWCARVAALLPHGSVTTIAGAPHAAHFTDPEAIAEVTREFITSGSRWTASADPAGAAARRMPQPPRARLRTSRAG